MSTKNYDFIIVGSGIVGLCTAWELKKKYPKYSIALIEKECDIGRHSSGNNSGVLHSGIYYKPNSIKAKICIEGKEKLIDWIKSKNLPILRCGKLILPQDASLDHKIDKLAVNATKNNVEVEILRDNGINKISSVARSASGRALWSPNTCVTSPIDVIKSLALELKSLNVKLYCNTVIKSFVPSKSKIVLDNNDNIYYGHLINCAGANADLIAKIYGVGESYMIIPFKGVYYDLRGNLQNSIKTNLYPVPDEKFPFLGVHFTPSATTSNIYIGPTATIAINREINPEKSKPIELKRIANNLLFLTSKILKREHGFDKYFKEQAPLHLKPLFFKEAKKLVPCLQYEDISISKKCAIRPQLFNQTTNQLIDEFLCIHESNSTHILNAISPAFTASFALGELITSQIDYG